MRYLTPRTENSCFALARQGFPPNNVDVETLLGKTAGRVQSLPSSRPNDGRQAYGTTPFQGQRRAFSTARASSSRDRARMSGSPTLSAPITR